MKFKTIFCSNEEQSIMLSNLLEKAGMSRISRYSLGYNDDDRWVVQFLPIGREQVEEAERICNNFIETVMMKIG